MLVFAPARPLVPVRSLVAALVIAATAVVAAVSGAAPARGFWEPVGQLPDVAETIEAAAAGDTAASDEAAASGAAAASAAGDAAASDAAAPAPALPAPGAAPEATPAAPPPTPMAAIVPGAFIWPVEGGIVTSSFGWRWGRPHEGIDIAADEGTPVRAVAAGVVAVADEHPAYGRRVVIDHGADGATVYAHLSTLSVTPGTPLQQGQLLGTVGCTGSCTGPHLHLESRVHDVPQNPRHYLP